ncbi:MAG TPA: O-methyltransferase [Capsulimonadaceae bacterium]
MPIESQAIDNYITGLLGPRYDLAHYDALLAAAAAGGLPPISISASQGQLMHVLVKATGARRILEIGTLGGYSGTWMASALPDNGRMVSLELSQKHADVARANFEAGGLGDKVEIIVGAASDTLSRLIAENVEPFDIVFIDADKGGYVDYLTKALQLVRKGSLILGDNTLSEGVLDGATDTGIALFNAAMAAELRLTSALVPVMKSHLDGLSISVVK